MRTKPSKPCDREDCTDTCHPRRRYCSVRCALLNRSPAERRRIGLLAGAGAARSKEAAVIAQFMASWPDIPADAIAQWRADRVQARQAGYLKGYRTGYLAK